MNPEAGKKFLIGKPTNIVIISLLAFILLMVALAAQFTYTILKFDKIYNGVYVSGTHIGNLDKSEAADLLQKNFQDKIKDIEITLTAGDKSEKFTFSDIGATYNIQETLDRAYSIGRSGNIFKRLMDIWNASRTGKTVDMPVSFDRESLEKIVLSLYNKTLINVKEADILIQDDKVVIRSGHHGENIDKQKTLSEVESMIEMCKGGVVNIPIVVTEPNKINVEDLYKRINREPKDAEAKVENGSVKIVPHVTGRKIDKASLTAIVSELEKTENTEKILPVVFIKPQITTEKARSLIFRDTLYTMSTRFSTADQNESNRAQNIKLAAAKINGKILGPGEVFSFNETVGPRTAEGGYQAAHTYVSGKIVDDIGGGICQVSSTLYNAVLFSDLEVVERSNHMFTVGYVPKGTDATVSYGSVDFKFRNSTRWPIKLEAWITSNKLFFSIKGTNETPGKTIEIVPQIVKTLDFKTKYIDDPTLPEGKTVVKQKGMTGYVVDTYKIVKQDGKEVSRVKLHTSTYRPLDQEVLRGTKKITPGDGTETVNPQEEEKPVEHVPGVDDASNPPAPQ